MKKLLFLMLLTGTILTACTENKPSGKSNVDKDVLNAINDTLRNRFKENCDKFSTIFEEMSFENTKYEIISSSIKDTLTYDEANTLFSSELNDTLVESGLNEFKDIISKGKGNTPCFIRVYYKYKFFNPMVGQNITMYELVYFDKNLNYIGKKELSIESKQ